MRVGETDIKIWQRMFRIACSFAEIAHLCEIEEMSHSLPMDSYSIPGIVNSAFACEVFMKSLLVYQGASLKEVKYPKHYLDKLWTRFKDKDPISASYIENQVSRQYGHEDTNRFNKKLHEINNAFQDWRYKYEKEKKLPMDRNFMRYFCISLRDKCCVLYYNQTWDEFVSNGSNWFG